MKTFQELYDLDISAKVRRNKDGDNSEHISWLDCLLMPREHTELSEPWPTYGVTSFTELPVSGQIIVTVWVKVFDVKHEITYTDARSRDFEFIKQRAFVKCVAIGTGLGLKLWDKPMDATPTPEGEGVVPAITMAFDAKRQELGFSTADELHNVLKTSKSFLGKLLAEGSKADQLAFLEKVKRFKLPADNDVF
jgi:hypothetical protein